MNTAVPRGDRKNIFTFYIFRGNCSKKMEPTDKRFKQFECGWAFFESASDDETTDGYVPTYEVGGVEEEWVEEGGVEDLWETQPQKSDRCSIDEVILLWS